MPGNTKSHFISNSSQMDWRREWDSNPRYGFPYTRFPSVRLQPLGHPSGAGRRNIVGAWVVTTRAVFASTPEHADGGAMGQGLKVLRRERLEHHSRAAVEKNS